MAPADSRRSNLNARGGENSEGRKIRGLEKISPRRCGRRFPGAVKMLPVNRRNRLKDEAKRRVCWSGKELTGAEKS
jgi:hypothetical protein